jgi:hypothetical protein
MTDSTLDLSQSLDDTRKLLKIIDNGDNTYSIAVNDVDNPHSSSANACTYATVGLASGQILAANADRNGLILVNTSANTISIGIGVAAVLYSGITLYANGGSYEMGDMSFSTQAIYAIAAGAGSNLAIQEFE